MSTSPAQPGYARIISLRVRPDDIDTLVDIYHNSSLPMVRDLPGLILIAGVANRQTGQAASITVWETPEDRERGGMSNESAANLSRYAAIMLGSYVRDAYDVTVLRGPTPGTDCPLLSVARITPEDVDPARWDDATTTLRATAAEMAGDGDDCYTVMAFESHAMSRALLVELATSREALDRRTAALRQHQRAVRSQRLLRRPLASTTLEVFDSA